MTSISACSNILIVVLETVHHVVQILDEIDFKHKTTRRVSTVRQLRTKNDRRLMHDRLVNCPSNARRIPRFDVYSRTCLCMNMVFRANEASVHWSAARNEEWPSC